MKPEIKRTKQERGKRMREIKFRAWDKKNKEMIDVDSLEIYDELDRDGFYNIYEVLNNPKWEVMQFTGLLDKNGKEIYESDWVEIKNLGDNYDGKWEIIWQDEYARFWLVNLNTREPIKDDVYWWNEFKIIGNKYENPELLK